MKPLAPTSRRVPSPWRLLSLATVISCSAFAQTPVLRHSDVVFMYQATPTVYEQYGATVLAWGGKPTAESRMQNKGIKVFGSVGMVTEFARYYDRFPDRYQEGVCRDIHGQPVKVPWLTDHQHHGVPFWWCCTQQPLFRQYLSERVIETTQAGADGVHIDDHMGTAGGLWLGLCFCDRCVAGFERYLAALPPGECAHLGIKEPSRFDFRAEVQKWMAQDPAHRHSPTGHPLWNVWTAYQCRAAAAFMAELRALAARTAGHPVPIGANAGLLWPRHLADYKSVDLFSAETDHHATRRAMTDLPLFAYRLADAVERPYAATASGGDWAYIKEQNLPGLVRGWVALAYASGEWFMAPHRQWCYTPEKGTHWYEGPGETFAPLYRFIRQHAELLDGFSSYSDLAVVLPHRAFLANPEHWFSLGQQLSKQNISFRLLLGGDDIVDHPLTSADLAAPPALLVPDRDSLLPSDRELLVRESRPDRTFDALSPALAALHPAVQVEGDTRLRVLPRVKTGAVAVHVVNFAYDSARDDFETLKGVQLRLNLHALGVAGANLATWTDLQGSQPLAIHGDTVELPPVGFWGIVSIKNPSAIPAPR